MPARPNQEMGLFGSLLVILLMLGLLALPGLAWWPLAFIVPAMAIGATVVRWHADKREAERRRGESICSFARSFDRRVIDPWIIRGVYEEFSNSYPIRADDSLATDLGIEDEDLDDSIVVIAERIGRSLEDTASNPMFDKLSTVGDLVLFLQHQPRTG